MMRCLRSHRLELTPTVLVVDTLVNTATQFSLRSNRVPGELNSQRLRSYRRVDVRWTRYFDTRRGRVSVFGEVYNLFDNETRAGCGSCCAWKDAAWW